MLPARLAAREDSPKWLALCNVDDNDVKTSRFDLSFSFVNPSYPSAFLYSLANRRMISMAFALVIISLDCIIQISFYNIESKEFIDTFPFFPAKQRGVSYIIRLL
jgi:hypothetical protein